MSRDKIKQFFKSCGGRLKSWFDKALEWIVGRFVIIKYLYLLRRHQVKNWIEYFWIAYLPSVAGEALSALYFIAVYYISMWLPTLSPKGLFVQDGGAFFIAAGSMVGGMLAIVFTISSLIMQNVARATSAGLYTILANDVRQKAIYWIIAIFSLTFFVLGSIFSSDITQTNIGLANSLASMGIFMVGSVFWFLYVIYERVFFLMNPRTNSVIIKRKSINDLKALHKWAERAALVMQSKPGVDDQSKKVTLASSYLIARPWLSRTTDRINYLFDYHDKLLSQQEKSMALTVLAIIRDILGTYITLRSESSVIVPSDEFLIGISDSQSFLTPHLENLVDRGSRYIKENNGVGTTFVINIFSHLATISASVKYPINPASRGENPIFNQCNAYLDQLIQVGIVEKNMEALFQAATVKRQLARLVIKNGLPYELESILNITETILANGLINSQSVVVSRCFEVLFSALGGLINAGQLYNVGGLSSVLRILFDSMLLAVKSGRFEDRIAFDVGIPLDNLVQLIRDVAQRASKPDLDTGVDWKRAVTQLIDELLTALRRFSEHVKNADHLIMHNLGHLIGGIGDLLVGLTGDNKWSRERPELLKHIKDLVYQPGWFVHYADTIKKNALSFGELVDSVAQIGLRALLIGNPDVAIEAIKAISSIATNSLKKMEGSFGYTEVRIFEKACYIGILAKKLNQGKVLDVFKTELKKFLMAHDQVYGVPTPPASIESGEKIMQREIMDLVDEMQSNSYMRGMLKESEGILFENIEPLDIDKFTLEVWRFVRKYSPLAPKDDESDKKGGDEE